MPGRRNEDGKWRSAHFRTASRPTKKLDQETSGAAVCFRRGRSARNSSAIPCSGASRRTGLYADMIESGTTIVRVQDDIALKLNPSREGMSTISGGTQGHSS